ncbi:hypothetical protein [Cytophaga hutchinsonii]|jgi:hypothetical protein|uniref:Uncharacterized protein n=1 Tax=Cytophaga hutchinsonii (strain ATCC 33406 / DSM 1761 / CIP 103989 / NBRC 15051 / NCIMB 9469 / D465) TaxID=269798 RepID=A0A6N4SMF7_CYTH3|nr:hypothetical protein [Cytophaga hutchinsonii]ABG57451.1 hypothetical protein CHU_0159 [Cytophaga hutchinsonii ATCC 33406]SFW97939.1 hypothetical protein SAMN04487930_10110 [Cytophaga hutchinsonii ATCC 33406]
MLAHFMLFSEADIEYRFLLATTQFEKSESLKPSYNKEDSGYLMSRYHKISLGFVNARNRNKKK